MTHSAASAPNTAEHGHHPPADPRRWAALALICLAQFMLILDVTVVNVALPDMAADLDLGRETLTWVVTAYTLCFGGLMLLGGRLADALGARGTLLSGLALFTAASLATGLAENASTLLGGRIAKASAQLCCHRLRCPSSPPPSTVPNATRRSASGRRSAAPAPRPACSSEAR